MNKYTQLTEEERYVMLRLRASVRAIADILGRAPSAISREIRRNAYPNRRCYITHHTPAEKFLTKPRLTFVALRS